VWWKNSWHEGAARVPWFVQLPAHRGGELPPRRLQTPVSLADLYPTLCGFAGASPPDGLDGVDLSEAIRGGTEPQRDPVWLTNPEPRWGEGCEHVVVRDGRYKYVKFRGVEPNLLFDLDEDPLEQHNLVVRGSDEDREVAERLDRFAAGKWDFDAAEQQSAADREQMSDHLPGPAGAGNLYHWVDGRIINAETPLYDPDVVIEHPADEISDYPSNRK
jgi:choline-sulfatase